MALTASLDVLKAIAEGGGPREGLLALGYAGWGPGQLDAEIQQNAWLSVPADETIVFDGDHDTKWRRALAKLKIDPLLLSGAAGTRSHQRLQAAPPSTQNDAQYGMVE